MYESVLRDETVKHLEAHNLINDSQLGFRHGRSRLSNLLEFLDKVTRPFKVSNDVDVINLDFAKAFDKVPHERLLQKLRSHGIGGKVWNWLRNWLSNRKQRICIAWVQVRLADCLERSSARFSVGNRSCCSSTIWRVTY